MRIRRLETVDSTSECAFRALAAGEARDGDLFVAREQTAGRGRQGRTWESAPGEGLYLSLVHRPPAGEAPAPAGVTMAAGLAVLDVVRARGVPAARLDWPNDVVVRDAKLSGVLVEARGLDPAAPVLVVGVGLNVLQRAFPERLTDERAVTSLALEGVEVTPEELVEELGTRLEERLREARRDPAALARAYLEATGLEGRAVRVRMARETHPGTLVGLDLEKGILLRTDRGEERLELAHVHGLDPA